jgi:hypothetical protein
MATQKELEVKYWIGLINENMVGGKIVKAVFDDSDEYDVWFGFELIKDGVKRTVLFSSDEEGNGGGRFFIENEST